LLIIGVKKIVDRQFLTKGLTFIDKLRLSIAPLSNFEHWTCGPSTTLAFSFAEKQLDPSTAARVTAAIVTATNKSLQDHSKSGRSGRVIDTRELVISDLPSFIVAYTLIDERPVIFRVICPAAAF